MKGKSLVFLCFTTFLVARSIWGQLALTPTLGPPLFPLFSMLGSDFFISPFPPCSRHTVALIMFTAMFEWKLLQMRLSCGPQTRDSRKITRNTNSRAAPWVYWIRNLGMNPETHPLCPVASGDLWSESLLLQVQVRSGRTTQPRINISFLQDCCLVSSGLLSLNTAEKTRIYFCHVLLWNPADCGQAWGQEAKSEGCAWRVIGNSQRRGQGH